MEIGRAPILGGGVGGGGAMSPTTNLRQPGGTFKRKRSGAGPEDSPATGPDADDEDHDRSRNPPVKRACNECRQQKVSHGLLWADVVQCNYAFYIN